MRKSKKYSKMRGGDSSTPSSSNSGGLFGWMNNAWNSTKKSSEGFFSKVSKSTSNMLNSNKSTTNSTPSSTMSSMPSSTMSSTPSSTMSSTSIPSSSSTIVPSTTQGGRKSRHRKRGGSMTGIYGSSGRPNIAFNAAPVHNLNVAKPTYWVAGKKTRKSRKSLKRRHRK